jgi:hypothetical protein
MLQLKNREFSILHQNLKEADNEEKSIQKRKIHDFQNAFMERHMIVMYITKNYKIQQASEVSACIWSALNHTQWLG